MRIFLMALVVAATATAARAQTPAPMAGSGPTAHVLLTPGDIKWAPAPPGVPPGAMVAVLDGDPSKPGPFTIRLKMPAGYKVAPHWHPTDEHLTVLQGTFRAGMGDAATEAGYHDFPPGSYISMPKEMHHFAGAKGETIIQIYGPGPFVVNYLNPADDPSKKTGTK